jgi:hypothetical protein
MTAELRDLGDRHEWALTEHRVTQFAVELSAVRLHAWSMQASLEVRITSPFTIREADGSERTAEPGEPEQLAPLLTLVGRYLELVTVGRDALELALSDGTTLHVPGRRQQDAFEVQGGGALEGMEYRG